LRKAFLSADLSAKLFGGLRRLFFKLKDFDKIEPQILLSWGIFQPKRAQRAQRENYNFWFAGRFLQTKTNKAWRAFSKYRLQTPYIVNLKFCHKLAVLLL
jgi:hypothetical protein